MGAPESGMQGAEQPTAETLLTAFRTIKAAERLKHEGVLDYWLSIRGDKEFPPLHDLDPLEISDAGPCSILLELIGGGQDAEIRHLGEALEEVAVQRIIDAPNPSILASIARKLPIVAISRDFLAFEDSFGSGDSLTRCWVTLLPLSSCGSWVDYVYAFVSVETTGGKAAKAAEAPPQEQVVAEEPEAALDVPSDEPEIVAELVPIAAEDDHATPADVIEPLEAVQAGNEAESDEPANAPADTDGPGFGKLLGGISNLAGFYGQGIKVDAVIQVEPPASEPVAIEPSASEPPFVEPEPTEPEADEPFELEELAPVVEAAAIERPLDDQPEVEAPDVAPEPAQPQPPASEGALQSKLSEVRAKADEARMAQLRATEALHQGLSDAYDFALDAESSPEEYLRLVEAQGLKIQLRAPMAPVVKLAFEEAFDSDTIAHLEAVLAWALKQELPRGTLAERIDEAGGIAGLLNGTSRPS